MLQWSASLIHLPLRYEWKLSRNATSEKTNLIISVTDGKHIGKGEAAPNIRYDETPEGLMKEFEAFQKTLSDPAGINSIPELIRSNIKSQALTFALSSAYDHFSASSAGISLYDYLKVKNDTERQTSYTIPVMDPSLMKEFYTTEKLSRFGYIKLKLNREISFEAIKYLLTFCDGELMVDANEAFTDVEECIYWMEKIKRFPLKLIEQPLPSAMKEEALYLKKYANFPLFADESVRSEVDFSFISKAFDGINMKLMKAGSYDNGIRIMMKAKELGMQTMIGCMVETTLGISSALHLSALADYVDLDSFLLLKKEPFRLVEEINGRLSLTAI